MLKTTKIFILCFIFILFSLTFVYGIDMNLTDNNENNILNELENTAQETNNDLNTNGNEANQDNNGQNTDSKVGLSSLPESNLGFANILNILLIVVGIILILLAIAILIRLKNK